MKEITTKVYTLDELSDDAKEKARSWWREHGLGYEWWESTYDDAEMIGLQITAFGLDRDRHAKGKWITNRKSGGQPANGQTCATLILAEHGEDCETWKDAKAFLAEVAKLDENADDYETKIEELDTEFLRTIREDYSILLQKEYEWLLSNEQVDETIKANEYTFTEEGERFG